MMANFLGVEVFNKGIEEYLKKHTYGNAKQVKKMIRQKMNEFSVTLSFAFFVF